MNKIKKIFYDYERQLVFILTILSLLLYLLLIAPKISGAENILKEKKDHSLAEKMIEWPPDKVFFQIIDLSDEAMVFIKGKVVDYREFLIEECAKKSARSKITEKEFEGYKIKINKCSDTENLILFIMKLLSYQGNEDELAFEGSIF